MEFLRPLQPTTFQTIQDIPERYFEKQQSIYGRVTQVLGPDTVQIRHVKGFGLAPRKHPLQQNAQQGKSKKSNTLPVRIYGVQAPDPASPWHATALEFAQSFFAQHQMVKITLLRRRSAAGSDNSPSSNDNNLLVIGRVETEDQLQSFGVSGAKPLDFSLELARAGLAKLQKGGEFHGRRGLIDQHLTVAQQKKRGIWSRGATDRILLDRTIDIIPHQDATLWERLEEERNANHDDDELDPSSTRRRTRQTAQAAIERRRTVSRTIANRAVDRAETVLQ
mmetsp:Transcript_13758/g.28410  ORF Transcript_13758/g.28410 Transcript_13758/m.28410 type:complete len:279 (-) Transcript_13758:79-915(-)|eukprot:CAMPEP_0172469032 /NCGR_PEP_ID=MMETSP1065-20121228/62735_1 /TAXON_ID=265537 /ORGANISM="Amphiprora paludosa, Strain CCMP125" /LENGTH=278 /DNA_ID=CAMNT_0013226563 /DNA_START=142 /DNA_END=978 /DNA_ORIENTATION=+